MCTKMVNFWAGSVDLSTNVHKNGFVDLRTNVQKNCSNFGLDL